MPMAAVPNIVPALPEVFLACVAMALLLLGVFQRALQPVDHTRTMRMVSWLAVIALALAILLAVGVTGARVTAFNGLFVNDRFALFFKVAALSAAAVALFMSTTFLERQGVARFEYGILILFATIGMMMMVSANDLISLYVGLELQSLSLYVLAAFQRDDARSTEAGLKYFVLGALASGLLLYGASLVYGFTGGTGFDALAAHFAAAKGAPPSLGVTFGLVFVLAGLAFKVSAVPFHMWAPDVYEGAPTPVTAFFAAAPKIAAVGLLLRVLLGPFADLAAQWQQIVWLLSVASMVLGAFAAINQRNIKRMMAYSSIGHVGYALIGLSAGGREGAAAVLVYMAIYVVMNLGAFACVLAMKRAERMVEGIDDLAGAGRTHPLFAAALAIFMASMAGIPPFAGFFGKLYVFKAAISAGAVTIAVIGVLSSVVAAFFYLRIIKILYFDEARDPIDRPVGARLGVVLLGASLLVSLFFLHPQPLIDGAEAAVGALIGR